MEGPAGAELSSEAVLSFLAARGGRVRHAELVQHFQGALGGEAEQRARARAHFKELVNAVAKVRTDPADGAKYVHLKKRFCEGAPPSESESESGAGVPPSSSSSSSNSNSSISAADNAQKATRDESAESTERIVSPATPPSQDCDGPGPAVMPGPPSPSQAGDPPSDGAQTEEDSKPLQQQPSDLGSSLAPEHPQIPSLQDSDAGSAPPGGGPAPRSARQNLRDLLAMGAGGAGASSPQLKRSPGNSSGGGGGRGKSGGDSDTASVASSSAEEESTGGGSVTLDPLEHAWMLSASDGKWDSLEELLACEPGLLTKRDFITGFTCLHWAAKHGRQELLALLVNFAGKHQLPVNINARTSGGYTALHLAAMHGHVEVVKLLVGAYDADVDIRDYSGKKAYQYLSQSSEEIKNLAGALEEEEEEESASSSGSGRWRLSKVLPSHLIAHRLSHVPEDGGDYHYHRHPHPHPHHHIAEGWAAGKVKDPARKIAGSSSGRMRPRLNKIRFRTQIVHTTPPFKDLEQQPLEEGDEEDLDRSLKGHSSAFKFRPKSNVFG